MQEEFHLYGQINTEADQPWIIPHLAELHDDARYALSTFSTVVKEVCDRDYSDYKPEIAMQKKREPILKAQRATLSYLKKYITKAKDDVEAVRNKILRVTESPSISDPTQAMLKELRNQEIRSLIRNTNPKYRQDLITGNLAYIQALIDAPDDLITKESLTRLRREYAFQQDSTLIAEEKDTIEIAKAVKRRAGEINATAIKMLINAKLDNPLPPAEHFETFTPETEHEAEYANKRIQAWSKTQTIIEKKKEWDEKNVGVNMQAGARAERVAKGLPHN